MNLIKRFLASEDGPSAVEYSVILALIMVVSINTITALGTKVKTSLTNTSAKLL